MNATLKSICSLLRQSDVELQVSAIRVLGAIHTREPGVHRALGELLAATDDPVVFGAIVDEIAENPHEQMLKFLLEVLESNSDRQEQVLTAIARIGGKAVVPLKRHFDRASTPIKLCIISTLPRIRTTQAHAFLVECFFSSDHEVIRQAVHALREEVHAYGTRERSDLHGKLMTVLKDRRLKGNDASLSAVIIGLGILADIRCKEKLLGYTTKDYPTQIRRHAMMSLARLEYVGEKHGKVFKTLLPVLEENDYEGIVRHAVSVLMGIKPLRGDNANLQALLKNKHVGVREYAIHALSQLDNLTNAEMVLEFLFSTTAKLRDAASEALRKMPSAVTVILRHLDEVEQKGRAFEMVNILESHGNRIKPDRAREMIKHMYELYEKGDDHYQLYRTALRHLRGEVLQAELVKMADKARKKKDFETVRDALRLLDHTELMTPEIRFKLAIAKLKTSKKDRSRAFRQSDYCLEHIAHLLHDDPKGFAKKFSAESALESEDFLYVGYHFSERLNKERRFGVDMLRTVTSKWRRSPAAKVAREKLKVEGH